MRDVYLITSSIYVILNQYKDHNINIELLNSLKSLLRTMTYTAPEILQTTYYFTKLNFILNSYVTQDDYDNTNKPWAKKIIDILIDKKIDD